MLPIAIQIVIGSGITPAVSTRVIIPVSPYATSFFDTFKNLGYYQGNYGFYDGTSANVLDMLRFKNISSGKQETTKHLYKPI